MREVYPKISELKRYPRLAEIAKFYGFSLRESPEVIREDFQKAKSVGDIKDSCDYDSACTKEVLGPRIEEKVALLRAYMQNRFTHSGQPAAVYFEKPMPGSKKRRISRTKQFDLEIIGSDQSVAEALVIKAAYTMLSEEGFKNLVLEINSVGDRDSATRFERELIAYFRRNIENLSPDNQRLFKHSVFDLFRCGKRDKAFEELVDNAPQSMNFLSEPSRRHFKEVLEYLETLSIPYIIRGTLHEHPMYSSHTVFRISTENGATLASGCRYNGLARRIGIRKDIPAVGISLCYADPKIAKNNKIVSADSFPGRLAYLMQLGFEAKLRSLFIIEELRQNRISLEHSLMRDKAASQLSSAEFMKLPYVLILGKKEVNENSIAVRETATRVQRTVSTEELASYLKKVAKTK